LPEPAVQQRATTEVASDRPKELTRMNMTFSECLDLIKWARKRQEGQTMAEYAVVLGVITLAVVGVFTALSGGISGAISTVTSRI
jgi:Flp pilus assembly pilin Flp